MKNRGITVSQLNNYIKSVFEAEEMLHNVEVIGEISGFKTNGKQTFFTLKDESAEISCTMFSSDISVANGTKVIARGTVSYWNKAGKISFIVNRVEEFGLGDLMKLFQQLQEKLRLEGFFDIATKKAIPENVKRLGVITSKSGAVLHDILTVARRRNPNVDIVLFPVTVQGMTAEHEIAHAIEYFNQANNVDVLIVARGGGSAEDLQPFNTETVARAVFKSQIPVISAVGHETDFTLIDFVSDLRSATPSVATELAVREIVTERDKILRAWDTLKFITTQRIDFAPATAKWESLRVKTLGRFSELENQLQLSATKIDERNPISILSRGFAKPLQDLSKLKTDDDFEILYYNDKQINKGVATWKNKIN